MIDRDRLKHLVDELPDAAAGELLDFAEFLRAKQAREAVPAEPIGSPAGEDRAWLDADLSRMAEVEPYDWGAADPLAGEVVAWDEKAETIVVGDAHRA